MPRGLPIRQSTRIMGAAPNTIVISKPGVVFTKDGLQYGPWYAERRDEHGSVASRGWADSRVKIEDIANEMSKEP